MTNRYLTGKPRLLYFDVLKLFAIFLVLWGHSIQYFLSSDYADEPVYRYIYSFHMPLFMMISGYFALSSMKLRPVVFLKKKFNQLLLPCISWSILLWLAYHIINQQKCPTGFLSIFLLDLWFLKSVFICYIVVYCGYILKINVYLWIILTLFVSQLLPYYNLVFMYPCFLVGMGLKITEAKWQSKAVYLLIISFIVFFILLCFWDRSFWQGIGVSQALAKGNNDISMLISAVYKRLYRIIIGIAGSFTFIYLFYLFFKKKSQSRFTNICSHWGQYTLGIYILQSIILEKIMYAYINLDNLEFVTFNFIVAPFISILVLLICVVIIKMINNSKVLSFLLFGKSYSKLDSIK